MQINPINILGGEDAKDELDTLSNKGYKVDDNYGYTGGYYQQDNKTWISWSLAGDEIFVEDFKDKADAIFYAMGVPVELTDGSWK
tara:strand:- start:33 stop:287 length:255 start_codon:yes stop_codon:yes gene_type:complete